MTTLNDARPVLIVFADQAAKQYRVGWYAQHDVARARVEAAALGLTTIEILSEQLRAFALTLPRGGFLADGKLHLDLVSREVIDRLLALRAADQPKGESGKPQRGQVTSSSPGEPSVSTSGDTESTPASAAGMAKTEGEQEGIRALAAPATTGQAGASRTPAQRSKAIPSSSRSTGSGEAAPKLADLVDELWSKVTIGSLVIAPEDDREDGWWEALVVDKRGNTLTLRWRDFPKLALITRKLKDVALLHPKASI
jgi:hypothetical protein